MANLPENNTYIKSNNVPVPNLKPPVPKAPAQKRFSPSSSPVGGRLPFSELQAQMEAMKSSTPDGGSSMPYDAMNYTLRPNTSQKPTFNVGSLLGAAPAGPLSDGNYVSPFEEGVTPGANSMVRTAPGIGQYVTDPDQPGQIMRSQRPPKDDYTWNTIKRNALEGRSSRLFEVDHAIPLWLGGTNSPENITVLTRAKHGEKTKAEAVALTLLSNNVIDRDEAFRLATTWQTRDLSIVPKPETREDLQMSAGQTNGQIPLDEAIKIRNAWVTAETAKPKISFGDFWKGVKNNPLLYGFSKGLTANAVKDNPDVPTGAINSTLSTAGNLAGSLLTVTALGKLFGLGGKAIGAYGATKGVLAKAGIATEAVDTARKVSVFTPKVATTLKEATDVAKWGNFAKWTPPVMLYGQVQESFEYEPHRLTRAIEDITYGGLTGFFAPNLKGAAKTAVSVGLISMAVDTFNGRTDNLAQNTLITALTIGGLHGISAPGVRKQAEEVLRNETTRTANNVLSLYMPKVRTLDAGEAVPTYTLQQIDEMEGQLADSMSKRLAGEADGKYPPLSEEEFIQQAQVIDSAFDMLRLGALKGDAADSFAAQKLQQFIKTVNNPTERENFFGGAIPQGRVTRIVDNMPEDLRVSAPDFAPDPALLSGVMRTTGLAKNYHPDLAGLGEFFAQPQNNYKTVIAIRRPEREGLNKFLSDNKGTDWTDTNPANTIQLVGVTKTADGGIKYTSLGYVPQENRILASSKGGRPNAINDQTEIKNETIPEYDVNFNKDTLSEAMDREGLDYIYTTLRKYGYEGQASGKPNLDFPFVEFSIGKDNWARSIEAQKGLGRLKPSVAEDGAQAVLARANTTSNAQIKAEAVDAFVEGQSLPAAAALKLDNPVIQSFDAGGITAIKAHLTNAEDALSSPDVVTMTKKIKEYFDIDLTREEQMRMFENRASFTADDLFTLIESKPQSLINIALGEMKPELDALRNSDEWEMRNVFNKMRIVGKEAPATVEVAPSVAAKTTAAPVTQQTATAQTPRVTPINNISELKKGDKIEQTWHDREAWTVEGKKDPTTKKYGVVAAVSDKTGGVGIKFEGEDKLQWIDSRTLSKQYNISYAKVEAPAVSPKAPAITQQVTPAATTPKQENVVLGGGRKPAENVVLGGAETPAVAAAVPENVVVPTGPVSPAAQSLVNKAVELGIVPPSAAVKPVEAPIITLDPKKHTPRIIEAAGIIIPQGGARGQRQQLLDQITNNTVSEVEGIIKNLRYTERIGAEGYKKQLLGIVDNVEPSVNTNPKALMKGDKTTGGLNLPLSPVEKMAIREDSRDALRKVALNTYRDKVTLDNELYFKLLGFKKGDPDYAPVKQMQEALDAEAFGYKREVAALRQEVGDEEFERIFRLLNEKADDEVVKSIGKNKEVGNSKKNIGVSGGMLGDTMASFKDRTTGKTITYDTEKINIRRQSGKQVIEDFVGKPQKNAKAGTYMRTFADAVDAGLSKSKLGAKWKTSPAALDLFATVNNKRFVDMWDDLLKKSDGEATQPLDYLRALGTGQRGKAQKIAADRQELQYKVKDEVMDRQSQVRTDDSGVPAENVAEEGMRTREITQLDDEQIPAPALMDKVMAGFTTAVNEGYTPTPEQALNDAMQFLFFANRVSPFGFNASISDAVTKEVVESLAKQGVRISNVKNPMKKAGTAYAEARESKKQADSVLGKEMAPAYKQLISLNSDYLKVPSVIRAQTQLEKVKALGEYLKKQEIDWEMNKPDWKGRPIRIGAPELKFIDSYKKFQNLMLQVNESDRRKEIMKTDAGTIKKKDGKGYPGPMDGQGGMIGDAWGKLKNVIAPTYTYTKPKESTSAMDVPLLKAESPHLLETQNKQKLPGEWKGTNYDPEMRNQNRPDATSTNLGLGAAGVKIQPGMAAVPRKVGSDEAMLRLGTVVENPQTGERFLIADLMNRRFDGMQKLDIATKGTGDAAHPDYNKMFSGWRIIREGAGREDARQLVESGEWEKLKAGKK